MAKKMTTGERFHWEAVAGWLGFASIPFLVALALVFWPNAQDTIPDYWLAVFPGICLMFAAFGFWGLILGFRYHTFKVVSGNRVWECSDNSIVKLEGTYYPLTKKQSFSDPTLSAAEEVELEKKGLIAPGTNELGEKVVVRALALGGFRWGGFIINPGEDGYVLFYGVEWIKVFENIIIPRSLQLIHHTKVDQQILKDLEIATKGKFRPYDSSLYVCGDFDDDMAAYLRTSPENRTIVLEAIGINGLARGFASQVMNALGREESLRLELPGTGWASLLPDLRTYLQNTGLYMESTHKGMQTMASLRSQVQMLQGQVTRTSYERDKLIDINEKYVKMLNQEAGKAATYRGGWQEQRPPPPTFGEERARTSGYENAMDSR